MQLNNEQMEAVHYINGPCLVIAGAGSGKTRVITSKILYLLQTKTVKADQILAVTFTNKAAAEMRERIAESVSAETASQLTISTFHALGRIIIQENHEILRLGAHFTIFDESDCENVLKMLLKEYKNFADLRSSKIADLRASISRAKGRLKTPRDLLEEKSESEVLISLYQKYSEYLRSCNAIDFDDLIFIPTRLLLIREDLRKKYSQRFQYILVDEYQDTNDTQFYLLMCLVSCHSHFTVVGDDDQSIYSWRGAKPENMNKLAENFKRLKVIKLQQNYRSTSRILRCANSIISNNPHTFQKQLFSTLGEGKKIVVMTCPNNDQACEWICSQIMGHRFDRQGKWSDYAVLYRSNSQARDLEKALLVARIPCRITGDSSFFDKAEVKDTMAWCRLINNYRDNSAFIRIINIPHRGIGAATLKKINNASLTYKRCLFDCACSIEVAEAIGPAQHKALAEFIGIYKHLHGLIESGQDAKLCDEMLEIIHYKEHLISIGNPDSAEWKYKNASTILQWIKELIEGGLNFDEALTKLGLREKLEGQEEEAEDNKVNLMTLHSAKGLEFPYVYLLGMEEGILPHRTSLLEKHGVEEERRLAYVGVTRARRELTMVLASERKVMGGGGLPLPQKPSRFISEMPQNDLEYCSINSPSQKEQIKEKSKQFIQQSINELKDLI